MVPTQKTKFNLCKNQIYTVNLRSFSIQRFDSKLISSKPNVPSLFVFFHIHKTSFLYLAFCSNDIWSDIRARKANIQEALEHSRHLESTLALGQSEGTYGHLSTQRAVGYWETQGTWALEHLEHLGHSGTCSTCAPTEKKLWHLGTRGILVDSLKREKVWNFIFSLAVDIQEANSKSSQRSKIKLYAIFLQKKVFYVWLGFKYALDILLKSIESVFRF